MPPREPTQAAALPYRFAADGAVEILLITTTAGRWSVPKGFIEPGVSAQQTALLEALEEAGAIGALSPQPLGTFVADKSEGPLDVVVFAMHVERTLDRWQEDHFRQRQWLRADLAPSHVQNEALAAMIGSLARSLTARGAPQSRGRKRA